MKDTGTWQTGRVQAQDTGVGHMISQHRQNTGAGHMDTGAQGQGGRGRRQGQDTESGHRFELVLNKCLITLRFLIKK